MLEPGKITRSGGTSKGSAQKDTLLREASKALIRQGKMWVIASPEPPLGQLAQVAGAPSDAAVSLQPRTPQDQALQGGLLPLVERAGPARPRPVAQALDPFRVVAVHPVAQGLPVHAGGPRRLIPAHPVQRVGQRKQARADPAVPL